MDYPGFRQKLQDYLGNKLEKREADLLREHISTCAACRMILDDVRASVAEQPEPGEIPESSVIEIDGYRIMKQLGKGGMGAVYRAVQLSLKRDVAVKVLSKEMAKRDVLAQRFEREARAAARLTHPNLIRVYEFGKTGETLFISMEFIDGKTVFQLIKEKGRVNPVRCLEIALKVAEVMNYAYKEGIIHRDIKPGNIMIESTGDVKLADLGLAKEIGGEPEAEGGLTMAGERLGTPDYMSPEQIKETKSVDHRADIYSLGATLFHMLTSRRPFSGKTAVETMKKVLETEVEFTEEEEKLIPPAVRNLVVEMMEKNFRNRIQKWKLVVRKINMLLSTNLRGHVKKPR